MVPELPTEHQGYLEPQIEVSHSACGKGTHTEVTPCFNAIHTTSVVHAQLQCCSVTFGGATPPPPCDRPPPPPHGGALSRQWGGGDKGGIRYEAATM